jgi:hypothetical protein
MSFYEESPFEKFMSYWALPSFGFIIFSVIVGAVVCNFESCCNQQSSAQAEATTYLSRMRPNQPAVVACMPYPSKDGYVNCDALVDGRPVALECGATSGCVVLCNTGCRLRNSMQPGTQAQQ